VVAPHRGINILLRVVAIRSNQRDQNMRRFHPSLLAACVMVLVSSVASSAQTVIDEWANMKAPPAPELKGVTADPKTTALLMLDFVKQICNENRRPRCAASLPAAKQLLAEARAKGMLVVHSGVAIAGFTGETVADLAPEGKEPVVQGGPNKFLNTELEKILKDHGIKTVIVAGTAAHGAVLHTASEAVFRGFSAIVPVDTMSADSAFVEQYVAYHFTSAPRVAAGTTLTRVGMIKF
jgi:nicotinamidase-related amidase